MSLHQEDRPVLHMRRKPVLLGFIETMDSVDKQKCPASVLAPHFGGFEHLFQIRHAVEHRADLNEMEIRLIRQSRAIVVFPTPGGPQKIKLDKYPDANIVPKGASGPKTRAYPIVSGKAIGRNRSANGRVRLSASGTGA